MISLKLDSSGDLDINKSDGSVNTVTGDDYIAQKIKLLLSTNAGELPWNHNLGFHQLNLLASAENQNAVISMINDYLRNTLDGFGSFAISKYEINSENREVHLTGEVTMLNGDSVNTTFKIGGD